MADMPRAETPEDAQDQTMQRIARMFTDDGVAGYSQDSGPGVQCPICPAGSNESYVHISERINYLGNDSYDAFARYGLGVRGDVTAIEFYSETCPHRWALAFGFHKGATFVRVMRLPDSEDGEKPPASGEE